MSVLKKTIRFCVLAAASLSGSWVFGQAYHPFAEALEFDPDWQMFAPITLQDVEEMTPRQRANEGWFVTYDRVRQGFNRPQNTGGTSDIDFGWGNIWNLGVMQNDKGWLMSVTRITGPNVYENLYQPRANVFNANDPGDPANPTFPSGERNDREFGERAYLLQNSLNVGTYSNVEINKTWRMTPYRYGGILEPMVGVRLTDYKSVSHKDNYFITNTDLDGNAGSIFETLASDTNSCYNKMMLGQIGFRYYHYLQRWTLSSEFRAFAGQNFQTSVVDITEHRTEYGAIGVGNVPTRYQNTKFTDYKSNNETTVGMDLRMDAAFKLAKNFQVRAGVNMIYFGQGIWRGATASSQNNPNLTNQALVMPGFTLGMELNR